MQRGYIILIVGAALLISGIVISTLWAVPFAGTILRESTILSGASIRPGSSVNASTQVMDTSRPISVGIHVERNNATSTVEGQVPINSLTETVRNPNGVIITSNDFTRQIFTTFKPDITGKYTVTIYNLGHNPVSVGVLVGNLPFVGVNNQVNLNSLSGIIAGTILIIVGIIILIAGGIIVALDRSKTTTTITQTTSTEAILLAKWTDRFVAWLIDFVIVFIGLAILFVLISIPFWIEFPQSSSIMNMPFRNAGPFNYLISSLVFTAYWTYFESTGGQSIGKKLLHLKTTDLEGKNIDAKAAVLESFGKAFLLPIDVILGWIFTNDKRQRIFNRASNTIVIKLKENNPASNNVTYLKD
jgi:uncharacterized RDD family membrane protein YckC